METDIFLVERTGLNFQVDKIGMVDYPISIQRKDHSIEISFYDFRQNCTGVFNIPNEKVLDFQKLLIDAYNTIVLDRRDFVVTVKTEF